MVVFAAALALAACSDSRPRPKPVQQISLVRPLLPPKPVEKPPEPEKPKEEIHEEVKVPEEAPKDEGPPPGEDLGLDAAGGAGGDSFGLVGRPGGTDITKIGGGGAGGDRAAWFSGQLQREIQQALMRNPKLRGDDWSVVVRLWFSPEGAVRRVELAGTSGKADTDALLRGELAALPPLREKPPEGLPQPVRMRIASRL